MDFMVVFYADKNKLNRKLFHPAKFTNNIVLCYIFLTGAGLIMNYSHDHSIWKKRIKIIELV